MNSRTAARELAFLALGQISASSSLDSEKLILAATRTLRDIAKQQVKKVQKDLEILGQFFFNEALDQTESQDGSKNTPKNEPLDISKIHDNVAKLELAAFALKESLDLPELLNQPKDCFDYAGELINLYRENKERINEIISEALETRKSSDKSLSKKGWSLDRVLSIDRTILKIATVELMFQKDCPAVVAIDEAIEIAKKYGSEESPKFVNGVLADISHIVSSSNRSQAVQGANGETKTF